MGGASAAAESARRIRGAAITITSGEYAIIAKAWTGSNEGRLYSKREIAAVSRGRRDVQGSACLSGVARRKK
jgi:hypothetical protein